MLVVVVFVVVVVVVVVFVVTVIVMIVVAVAVVIASVLVIVDSALARHNINKMQICSVVVVVMLNPYSAPVITRYSVGPVFFMIRGLLPYPGAISTMRANHWGQKLFLLLGWAPLTSGLHKQ